MRRAVAVWVAVVGLLVGVAGFAGSASAASTTVQGTGPITKMRVDNASTKVVTKIYGDGGKDAVRWVNLSLRGKDGVTYTAKGANYPGGVWAVSLEKGAKLVTCDGLRLRWVADKGFWKFVVPRSCLKKLTDKVKATGELVATTNPMPGEAGPTKWLARG